MIFPAVQLALAERAHKNSAVPDRASSTAPSGEGQGQRSDAGVRSNRAAHPGVPTTRAQR